MSRRSDSQTAPTPAGTSPAAAPATDERLWYKDAVIYQAHVKSFFDSTGDGVGDFAGLTQKLDYLQSLGITCLWLLPFFPSPLRDDGYDIADYRNVHPSYGTLDDFKRFVDAAHARGIKVLIELVVNHTSDQHPWFQRARQAPRDSPERAFYVWNDDDKAFAQTRIIFSDTEKSNWAYDAVAGQYYWHRFFSHQPDLNHNNPAVVDAVIDVMRFWLDLGVDAFRLDAVPYLCVREGTTNENLPETHAVLKRMRRALDDGYRNRMLIAEANQWPSDVRPYFGDGDECHMAFHFPLMPRMFMAIRQEDRYAITEILSQTPELPESCQWALFLRNHDELTLEMVTDEERDYMYQAYAADPQMRLNAGIRRRLAPLVENSRRRIELLNGLLFSLPGTPIVYYGDEIGMGDNIYLGDRNGVRTPMQWTGDRNGGFSRADPARLVAPVIQDPVYGFQAINVEAQERYPFSQLNWMKRLIAMRRQHPVFGRGSLEFVDVPNRKVLAYLRRDERETILCVVNLSRAVQPAELDLKAFSGLAPVEMFGLTEFPRITANPYFLTIGPYASYWFHLRKDPPQLTPRAAETPDPATRTAALLPSLIAGTNWQSVLDATTRAVLERQALVPFLQRQQWFTARAREIRQARFTDWTLLRGGTHPAFLTIASVDYGDGHVDSYSLPLSCVSDGDAERAVAAAPARVLARITGARKGAIVDAFWDDEVCDRMLTMVSGGQELATKRGSVRGSAAQPTVVDGARKWTRASDAHHNSVAIVNDAVVLKLFRRIEPVVNPDYELARTLVERGFARSPRVGGALEYLRPGLDPGTIVLVESAVKNQGSAWDFTLDELRRYFERAEARTNGREPRDGGFFETVTRDYRRSAETLGRRTAELHRALASAGGAAFEPEPLSGPDLARMAEAMNRNAELVLDRLAGKLEALGPGADAARDVLARKDALRSRFDALRGVRSGGVRIRVHGDYHLGQVLRVEEDFSILDFEGDPALPFADRRAKQSPLKDVASMIGSFAYAAYTALLARSAHTPAAPDVLESWADRWQAEMASAFVGGYRAALAEDRGATLTPDADGWETMLCALRLDALVGSLGAEVQFRPDRTQIPLTSIRRLIS